ncbi:DUF4115 domain-containing protein [Rhodobacteraceae bacterium D3-12]|nr:DUF4115 domain-containing protein [Rhodobacteraceae bacterium D3-12]
MIGRRNKRETEKEEVDPKWFDDFDLRLGDLMRGERATLGKSLLDVQRELRIKAAYIAAIENADPSAFDTPGFIAGYVRSYARYLNMDPDRAFAAFCKESGFSTAHGMSAAASTIRKPIEKEMKGSALGRTDTDPFGRSKIGYSPVSDSFLSRVEPRAVGSLLVLVALVGALGFGGWTVLNEVQRVQVAPVDHTPNVLAELDPLEAAAPKRDVVAGLGDGGAIASGVFAPPSDSLDKLYRPQALDVPVMVARDAPISTLDPASIGTFAQVEGTSNPVAAAPAGVTSPIATPQVVTQQPEGVVLFAVRPAWVRIRAVDGTVIFEGTLDAGGEYTLPVDVEAPTLQAGMSGSLYVEIDGELFGPVGQGTATVRNLSMARADLLADQQPADFTQDPELSKVIALAEAQSLQPEPQD